MKKTLFRTTFRNYACPNIRETYLNKVVTLNDAIARYMTRSYKPCRITAPLSEWKKLKYENGLFGVCPEYFCDKSDHDPEITMRFYKLCFYKPRNIIQPVNMIHSILDASTLKTSFHVKYNEASHKETLMTLDTGGFLEIRTILMLKDFVLKNSWIDFNSSTSHNQLTKYWNNVCWKCPTNILINIMEICINNMMQMPLSLQVLKAPKYSSSDYAINHYDEIESRTWYTDDNCLSWPASIFFNDSKKLLSLGNMSKECISPALYDIDDQKKCKYDDFTPEPESTFGYESNPSSHGGIEMPYVHLLPWSQLIQYYASVYRPSLLQSIDISGRSQYSKNGLITNEEILVLAAALKHAGAEINISNNSYFKN